MDIWGFIQQYYVDPIVHDSGYNIYNTLTWALILGLSLFGILKLLRFLGVRIDANFVFALGPHLAFWSLMRVVEDMQLVHPPGSYLLITPLIHFMAFLVTAPLLVLCAWLGRRGLPHVPDYQRPFFWTGVAMVLALLAWMLTSGPVERIWVPLLVVGLATAFTTSIYVVARLTRSRAERKAAAGASVRSKVGTRRSGTGKPPGKGRTSAAVLPSWGSLGFLTQRLNLALLFAHMFDASSTFTGVDIIGLYEEKHVFPSIFIDVTGTAAVMYLLKLTVFIPVLYVLDRWYSEDVELSNLIKLVIFFLGFAPGLRNTMAMAFGV